MVIIQVSVHIDRFLWGSVSQPEDRNLIRLQLHGVVYLLTSCTYAQGSDVRQCSWCIHPSAKRSNKHLVKTERPQTPTSKALRSIAAVQCQSGRLDLNHHPRKSNHSAPFWWLYSSIKGCPKCQWKNTEVNYARDRFYELMTSMKLVEESFLLNKLSFSSPAHIRIQWWKIIGFLQL